MLTDGDELTYERVGLDAGAVANFGGPLNLNKWPYEAAIPDAAFIEIHGLHDCYVSAEGDIAYRDALDRWAVSGFTRQIAWYSSVASLNGQRTIPLKPVQALTILPIG